MKNNSNTFEPIEEMNVRLAKKRAGIINSVYAHFVLYNIPVLKTVPYVIAGGCLASELQGDVPRDIDLFFLNLSDRINIPTHLELVKNNDLQYHDDSLISSHVIRYNGLIVDERLKYPPSMDINVILTKFKTWKELIDNFDMLHCKMVYDPEKDAFFISKKAYNAAVDKKIVNAKNVPLKSFRVQKFIDRGYTIENVSV